MNRVQKEIVNQSGVCLSWGMDFKENPIKRIWSLISIVVTIAKMNFRKFLQYRLANVSGFLVNVFWFVVEANIMIALFSSRGQTFNYTVVQAVTYVGLAEALLMVSGISGALGEVDLDGDIRSGQFIVDLIRPVDYFVYILSLELGRVVYYLFFRAVPLLAVLFIFFDWAPPTSIWTIFLFIFSVLGGIIITNCLHFSALVLGFWLNSSRGILEVVNVMAMLFSGLLLPIAFFPEWLAKIVVYLPFAGQFYIPISIFLGNEPRAMRLLAVEMGWIVVAITLARILFRMAMKKISVQGG
ncbi:hypothetical protein BBF96_13725 [Anoxybacter fermentans]|uniref:ABC transporter permease n=1 Tax=Anoxybacter fermentans TaxID=1323375 RepID=A0A3S9T183_9FIRM|nr:ABC-2 family transporter protein [Anoxybacter fermentans]AZR74353.1 hypothetical protein BBF96_13725 [Anoxybacter fermentans]